MSPSKTENGLPITYWLFVGVLFTSSMVRESQDTQLVFDGGVYISWQFIALVLFGFAALPGIGLRLWQVAPVSLLMGGPLFFLYALTADWLRGGDHLSALAIDSAHALIPILVAIGLMGGRTKAQRHLMIKYLVITVLVIASIYGAVALLVNSVDFGSFVTARPPGHENMRFVRLSGPLGVSTGLSMILLPVMAFCWQEHRRMTARRTWWLCGTWLSAFLILWTASRLTPLFLGALFLFACSTRQILLFTFVTVAGVLAFDIPDAVLPEKWIRLGYTDPGRSMALDTTWGAFTSTWQAAVIGVGSDRLNIITQTVSQVARGELRFNSWSTEFGEFPYGPHSVFLWALGSYGVIGAVLRCAPFVTPFFRVLSNAASGFRFSSLPLTFFAILVSAIGFFLDDTHITHPYLTCLWYVMCFGAFDDLNESVKLVGLKQDHQLATSVFAGVSA